MYWENRGAAVVLIGACCDLEMLGRLERNKGKKFNFLKLKTSNLKEKKKSLSQRRVQYPKYFLYLKFQRLGKIDLLLKTDRLRDILAGEHDCCIAHFQKTLHMLI